MESSIETVLEIGREEFYRAARYQIPLSVLLINSDDKDLFNNLEKSLRPTDIIQQLSRELLVVLLTHTDLQNANTFVKNINKKIDFTFTLDEYKGFRVKFIEDLFASNQALSKEY